jgi:small subunit ribosomal protein S13
MPRIASVDIPENKRSFVALTYIFGIGRSLALDILKAVKIEPTKLAKDLTSEEVNAIAAYINDSLTVEGDLRRETTANIQRLVSIGCARGLRHREGLPVRGQRSRNKGGKRREKRRKRAA